MFYEGLLGGAAYVNTFYNITKEVTIRADLSFQKLTLIIFALNSRHSVMPPIFIGEGRFAIKMVLYCIKKQFQVMLRIFYLPWSNGFGFTIIGNR